jgi:hypothetical protein
MLADSKTLTEETRAAAAASAPAFSAVWGNPEDDI